LISEITASGGAAKKQKKNNSDDCLEIIQAEAHTSKGGKDSIYAAGRAKGFEEGSKSGRALGFAEGLERGRKSAARVDATEITSLRAANEALSNRLCDILEHSNGVATGQLIPLVCRPIDRAVRAVRKQYYYLQL
jgi:flagellar biosynthesis/type III secretory pathway protein FliH